MSSHYTNYINERKRNIKVHAIIFLGHKQSVKLKKIVVCDHHTLILFHAKLHSKLNKLFLYASCLDVSVKKKRDKCHVC
jgi:hypothetical protein